jgi:NADH:ubiquinone oxidoreductase subunit E
MIIQICIGSSCHLKGSEEVVELFKKAIDKYSLNDDITLAGSFCLGKCNRTGVTVTVDDEVFTGITKENFEGFFKEKVLGKISREKE